jgi:hypothetical protein
MRRCPLWSNKEGIVSLTLMDRETAWKRHLYWEEVEEVADLMILRTHAGDGWTGASSGLRDERTLARSNSGLP